MSAIRCDARIIRHIDSLGNDSFAIHDVYYDATDRVVGMTEDALSPREESIHKLDIALLSLIKSCVDTVKSGDKSYDYERVDIVHWFAAFELPVLDF